MTASRLLRRLLCRLGWHRWQMLMCPPDRWGEVYERGIWCVFCGAKWEE